MMHHFFHFYNDDIATITYFWCSLY